MEVPLEMPTDTNGETEGSVGLYAQGFFSKEGLAPDQAWSLQSLALVLDAMTKVAKAYRRPAS